MAGTKYDGGKPRLSLLSAHAMDEIGEVATFGAKKYADHNWRGGFDWSRLLDATMRHINKANKGELYDFDPNCEGCKAGTCLNHSGRLHWAAAAWNLMALIEFQITATGNNDLWKGKK